MAGIREATLTLKVDSRQARAALMDFIATAGGVSLAAGRSEGMIRRLGAALGGLYLGYKGLQYVRHSIRDFADFERQMANVSTMLSQQSMHLLPGYSRQIRQLSMLMGEGTTTLSKGLYDILSATIAPEKAMNVLEVSSRAAVAGLSTTAVAADAITTVLNSYGLSAEYAGKISSDLFETVFRGKTTFEELAPEIGMVAATAAQAGISLEELLATIATLTRAGLRTPIAVTALRTILMQFLQPDPGAIEAARELGFEMNTLTLRTIGLAGVLEKLRNASSDTVAKIIDESRGLAGFNAALQNIEGYAFDLDYILNKTGEDVTAFGKMADTTDFRLRRFGMGLAEVRRVLGEVLAPTLGQVGEKIANFVLTNQDRFHYWGLLVQNELERVKETFSAFASYLSQDFAGGAHLAWDIFLEVMEVAAKAAIDLAIRTGRGIWQGLKEGVFGGQEEAIEARTWEMYLGMHQPTKTRRIKQIPNSLNGWQFHKDVLEPALPELFNDIKEEVRQTMSAKVQEQFLAGFEPQWKGWVSQAQAKIQQSATESPAGSEFWEQIGQINAERDKQRERLRQDFLTTQGMQEHPLYKALLWPGRKLVEARDWLARKGPELTGPTYGTDAQGEKDQSTFKEFLREIQFEQELLGKTNAERQKAVTLHQMEAQARARNAELSATQRQALEKELDTLERMRKLREVGDAIGEGFARGFSQAAMNARSLKDVLGALEDAAIGVMERVLEILVWEPMAQGISAGFMKLFPAAGSAGTTTPVAASAHGRVFRGTRIIPFASGGIIDRPTMFPLAGGMGLAGEEGPEWAIAPLKRMPSGNLGVETSGIPAPSIKAEVHLHNESGADLVGEVRNVRFDGRRMMVAMVLKDRRNNGPIHRSNRSKR